MTARAEAVSSRISLDELAKGRPGITPAFGAALAEAATVCLEQQAHATGVCMSVKGDHQADLRVCWPPLADPAQAARAWGDPQVAVEHGAYGVASLLVEALAGWTVVERSRKGTGFDYWLAAKTDSGVLFQDRSRLEVSGIAKGSDADLDTRVRRKRKQIQQSGNMGLPAVVAVVEFGAPASRIVTS